jgi:hypothetical protein
MKQITTIEEMLEEERANVDRRVALWKEKKEIFLPIVTKLAALEIEPRFDGDLNVSFAGDKHKLAAVFRILRLAGFATKSERPKANDSSWNGYFHNPDYETIWVWFTSSVCRRVQTGTRIEEVPIYETVCGDNTIP